MKSRVKIFSFVAVTLLLTIKLLSCSDARIEIVKGKAQTLKSDSVEPLNVDPASNSCRGIPGGIPWTVVDGTLSIPALCDSSTGATNQMDSYERVRMFICSEGQVIETGEFRGRLISGAECLRADDRCGDYEDGQVRNLFTYENASYPCPEDSLGAIVVTYINRSSEVCDGGTWNSSGSLGRTIFQVDDSTCQVKPPMGQSCGTRIHNEVWSEVKEENKTQSCSAGEDGQVELHRTVEEFFTCLNGTVSRTAYTVGDWAETSKECHKNCSQVELNHGESRTISRKESETAQCEAQYTGEILRERTVTETLACMDGVVNRDLQYSDWQILQNTCKKMCDDGHHDGDIWQQNETERKQESCPAGYSGVIELQKQINIQLRCENGSISRETSVGEWLEVSNSCKKMCTGGKVDGETWSTVATESQTLDCQQGYQGKIVQVRDLVTNFSCREGAISSTLVPGPWAEKENSCVRHCPSGHSEGETWETIVDNSEDKACPTRMVGKIVVNTKYRQTFICQSGDDRMVKSDLISKSESRQCSPFTVSGRCFGDSLFATEVPGRRAWVRKCKDLPQIRFFFELGGESLYTHRNHYPTFGYVSHEQVKKFWKAPVSTLDPCEIPEGVKLVGLCTAGCFTEDQQILFGGRKYQGIRSAMDAGVDEVMVVRPESVLEDLQLIEERIQKFIVDIAPARQTIYEFKTQSGGQIQVTDSHPMLTANGRLVDAKSLKVGDPLILANGHEDIITDLRQFDIFDKVYNLFPDSKELVKNLVVAQGFITGSAFYQSEGNEYMGRVILRHSLVEDLFPESNVLTNKDHQ